MGYVMSNIYKEISSDNCEDMLAAYLATKPTAKAAKRAMLAAEMRLNCDEIYAIEAVMTAAVRA